VYVVETHVVSVSGTRSAALVLGGDISGPHVPDLSHGSTTGAAPHDHGIG
jgi:hypothetical protein